MEYTGLFAGVVDGGAGGSRACCLVGDSIVVVRTGKFGGAGLGGGINWYGRSRWGVGESVSSM